MSRASKRRNLALTITLAVPLAAGGCARSPCSQPDVLAYVDQASRSRNLYVIGLTEQAVLETPKHSGRVEVAAWDRDDAVCSARVLSRNPAFRPGNGQAAYLVLRQDFRLKKLETGYEVSLLEVPGFSR